MPISPNGKYGIEMVERVDKAAVDLYIVDLVSSYSTLLQDKIVSLMPVIWSPDSTKVAFVWFSGSIYRVSVVNADGSDNRIVFQSSISPALQNWSPDSLYLPMSVHNSQNNFIQFWSIPDERLINLPTHSYIYNQADGMQWSPVGDRLLYQGQNPGGEHFIGLASPETMSELTMPWAQNRGIAISDISWSPNGRYLALFSYFGAPQGSNWHVNIYRGDLSNSMDQVMQIDMGDLPIETADPKWIEDGGTLTFLREGDLVVDNLLSLSLEVYHLDRQKHDSFPLGSSLEFPVVSPEHQLVAVKSHLDYQQDLDILHTVTRRQLTLVAHADEMGDPYWSPDGQRIAVVWATEKHNIRLVRLTWANADGSGRHDLVDDLWDVQTLLWLGDKHSVAFVTWRNKGYGVEAVDLDTGTRHQLVDGMTQILDLKEDPSSGLITFWWRGQDRSVGTSGFDVDGKQRYEFKGRGPGEIVNAGLFWSPDHQTGALKMHFKYVDMLQLASPDGKWSSLLRDNLSGLGDPLWSQDSAMVAYTYSINQGQISLDVFSSTGDAVRKFIYPYQTYSNLGWSRCN